MNDQTRRGFLKTTTAAATLAAVSGFPTIVRASAVRGTRANAQVTLAIIGCGIRGRNIFNGYLRDTGDGKTGSRARVIAMCDVDQTRLDHYTGKVNEAYSDTACSSHANDEEIYARDDIDAVIITTPDHWHVTQCLLAISAGKDIYCEKPLTHTLHEGKVLIDACKKHGTVFQTGSQQRSEYGHKFARAVELVRAGKIGKVLSINVGVGDPAFACDLPTEASEPGLDWDRWLGPAPERGYHSDLSPRGVHGHYPAWRRYKEYCGGYFADMGAHHYDIAQWGLGMDESGPFATLPPMDGELKRGVRLLYENDVVVTHGGPSGTTFIGDSGMIHVDRGRIESVPGGILEEELAEEDSMPRNKSHMDNWLDCIASREQPICNAEVGARTAMVCQLVNITYWLRRSLSWNPIDWHFVDDDEANALLDYDRRPRYALPSV